MKGNSKIMSLSKVKGFNTLFVLATILATVLESQEAPTYSYGNCEIEQYRCRNERCVKKSYYCDGDNDCSDNSDEEYCRNQNVCPNHYEFFKCGYKCIPYVWMCDGEKDCDDGSDETNCQSASDSIISSSRVQAEFATNWFKDQMTGNATNKWGTQVPRIAVALYTSNKRPNAAIDSHWESLKYEVSLRLTRILLKAQALPGSVSPSVLASYLNALVVSCVDPTNFFGINTVQMLRDIVDTQGEDVNPFLLLALCNAGDHLSQRDLGHLQQVFHRQQQAWTSVRAFALMTMSCAIRKGNASYNDIHYNTSQMAHDLKKIQHANGSFETVQTTALVVQALMAAGELKAKDWDLGKAVRYLLNNQKADGSFGSLLNTYYALAVLNTQHLANLSSLHCNFSAQNKDDVLDPTHLKLVEKIHVRYSIALENNVEYAFTLSLRVPLNSSFFDLMKRAASLDNKYKFEYVLEHGKPRIYELNGIQDDPEYGTYWFLFSEDGSKEKILFDKSPVDVILQDKQEYIMWYRSTPSKNREHFSTLEYSTEFPDFTTTDSTIAEETTKMRTLAVWRGQHRTTSS